MRHILISSCIAALLGIVLFAAPTRSYGQCPPNDAQGNWTQVTYQQWTLPSGCVVKVTYCYRDVQNNSSGDGWERQFVVTAVSPVSGCTGINWDDIIHQTANMLNQGVTSLPDCNHPGKLMTTTLNTCWKIDQSIETSWGGAVVVACGDGSCTKTCSYCLGYNPSTGHFEQQVSNCVYTSVTGSGCTSEPSNGQWANNTCYSIPCGTW